MPRYKVTLLGKTGVHYEGNERFDAGVPRVVEASLASSLSKVVVMYTAYSPSGQKIPDPRPRFNIEIATEEDEAVKEEAVVTPHLPAAPVPPPVETTLTSASVAPRRATPPPPQ